MLFSSFSFLFWFLPLTLVLYFAPSAVYRGITGRAAASGPWLAYQNGVLLVMSLLFYAWGEPLYIFLMIGIILADTLFGILLTATSHKRAILWIAVFLHLSLLFYYKYAAFFASLLGFTLPSVPKLPLGISFYTFQALSYVIDIYRGTVPPERNPAVLGVYVALFPQLIAGPIVRYTDVAAALRGRTHSLSGAAAGTRRFVAGLCKKMLLANPMGALFSLLMGGEALSFVGALTALLAFAFQIYFDFSGYSDMAIGLGRIFGFLFPENFRYPYIARSITDFWRRWHITLSTFFKEYIYIPLGGNRHGILRTVCNIFAVWALTGLWHGASLNFLLWGVYYFLLLILEKFVLRRFLPPAPAPVAHFFAILGILLGWLIFAFDGSAPHLALSALPRFLRSLLGAGKLLTRAEAYQVVRHLPILLLCALGCTPLPNAIYRKTVCKKPLFWLRTVLPLIGLALAVIQLSDAGFNPFLYFRF